MKLLKNQLSISPSKKFVFGNVVPISTPDFYQISKDIEQERANTNVLKEDKENNVLDGTLLKELSDKVNDNPKLSQKFKNEIKEKLIAALDGKKETGQNYAFAEIQNSDYEGDTANNKNETKLNRKEFDKYQKVLTHFIDGLMADPAEKYLENYPGKETLARQLVGNKYWAINLLNKGVSLEKIKGRIELVENLQDQMKNLDNGMGFGLHGRQDSLANEDRESLKNIIEIIKRGKVPAGNVTTKFEQWDSSDSPNYNYWGSSRTMDVSEYISLIGNDFGKVYSSGLFNKIETPKDNETSAEKTKREDFNRLLSLYSHFQQFFDGVDREENQKWYNRVEADIKNGPKNNTNIAASISKLMETNSNLKKLDFSAADLYTNGNVSKKDKVENLYIKLLRGMGKTQNAGNESLRKMGKKSGVEQQKNVDGKITQNKEKQEKLQDCLAEAADNAPWKAEQKYKNLLKNLPADSLYRTQLLDPQTKDNVIAMFTAQSILKDGFNEFIGSEYAGSWDEDLKKELGEMGQLYADMEGLGGNWFEVSDGTQAFAKEMAIMVLSMVATSWCGGLIAGTAKILLRAGKAVKSIKMLNRFKKVGKAVKTFAKGAKSQNYLNITKDASKAAKLANKGIKIVDASAAFTLSDKALRGLWNSASDTLGIHTNESNTSMTEAFVDNIKLFTALGVSEGILGQLLKKLPKFAKFLNSQKLLKVGTEASADAATMTLLHAVENGHIEGEALLQDFVMAAIFRGMAARSENKAEIQKRLKKVKEKHPQLYENIKNKQKKLAEEQAKDKKNHKQPNVKEKTNKSFFDKLKDKLKREKASKISESTITKESFNQMSAEHKKTCETLKIFNTGRKMV